LVLAVCKALDSTGLVVTTKTYTNWSEPESVVWEATGEHAFRVGDTIDFGQLPDGMTTDTSPVNFDTATRQIYATLRETGTAYGWIIDGRKLSSSHWVNELGLATDAPC
jgi:hypothetical protein